MQFVTVESRRAFTLNSAVGTVESRRVFTLRECSRTRLKCEPGVGGEQPPGEECLAAKCHGPGEQSFYVR